MNALWVALLCLFGFLAAYATYGRFLARRIFRLDPSRATPAHERSDGVDHVPTRPSVLFGHHFASIAGLGPILGPAVAVIWGWVPALLWVFFGSIFFGGVHDLAALAVSLRHQGRSIGDITRDLVGVRAQRVFLVIIFFAMALAMGVFALIIATLFGEAFHPQAVVPSFALIAIAVLVGWLAFRRGLPFTPVAAAGFVLMLVTLLVGVRYPITAVSHDLWIVILLAYAFTASVLPVWVLLQPRDYLNSFLLYLGMALMLAGLVAARPEIVAPAFHTEASDLPPFFPFLFIVVACGAVSGFHSLVSSGTTAKQLDRESHALPIGYGAMLTEGGLATLAILACTAGLGSAESWSARYGSWSGIQGLGPGLDAFVTGAGGFVAALGIDRGLANAFIAVVAVGFALTTLDSATRLLRYNVEEIGQSFGVGILRNRYVSSLAAVGAISYFAFLRVDGKPIGLTLWALFGTTNQLLAALALVAATVWLYRLRRPVWVTLLPALFMMVATITAMSISLGQFWRGGQRELFGVGVFLLLCAIWVIVEVLTATLSMRRRSGTPDVGGLAADAGPRRER